LTSATTPAISLATYSTYYNITSSTFNTLTLPASQPAGDAGSFWVLRNNAGVYLTITVTYNSGTGPTTISIPPSNAVTLVWTGSAFVLF
jgi:hypothetical protein